MNPYMLHIEDNPNVHAVIFSAINTPKGKFKLFKTLTDIDSSKTFINVESNNWYQTGIPGVSESLANCFSEIKNLSNGKKNIYIGSSMGGYGAALYGCQNETDWVMSLGSEYKLSLPFSRSMLHMPEKTPILFSDVLGLINNAEKTTFYIFAGELDIIDLYNASLLNRSKSNIKIFIIKNSGHNVTKYINDEVCNISSLINMIINNDEAAFSLTLRDHLCRDEYFNNYSIEDIYKSYISIRNRSYTEAITILESIKNKTNISHPLYNLYYGMALIRIKKPAAALPFLLRSIKLSKNRDTYFELGLAYNQVNKPDEAIDSYKKCIHEDSDYAPAYHHLGLILEKNNNLFDAERNLQNAMNLNSQNTRYRYDLIRVLEKIITSKQDKIKRLILD